MNPVSLAPPPTEEHQTTAPSAAVFDEAWYLGRYPNIANAVSRGLFVSGWEHYLKHGRAEGLLPVMPDSVLDLHRRDAYLTPTDLSVSGTSLRRVALIGSCFLEGWKFHKSDLFTCPVDLINTNNGSELPVRAGNGQPIEIYDFVVVQIGLRTIMPDGAVWQIPYAEIEHYEAAFQRVCDRLAFSLRAAMVWNEQFGLLTFVANFLVPQRNPMGALFPRYDIRNPEYFVERLNQHLEQLTRARKNAYILDVDRISASFGRRYVQDDGLSVFSHNSLMGLEGPLRGRMEPVGPMADYFEITWPTLVPQAIRNELLAMYRTVHQVDTVKLVIVDLDDTLWNGVSGDMGSVGPAMVEGWPIGFVEALLYLKKRGTLLAICSKNDEGRIREIWPKIFTNRLSLADFAAVRINWAPKTENVREILEVMNLLPRSVVFIDDNPVERAAMEHAFPDIRVLGRHPYYLRRILLWSSETQTVSVTAESARRTEMVQSQFTRESQRKELSREEFLRQAAPKVTIFEIESADDPRFPRVFELVNKTNQFNTTGERWKPEACDPFFTGGGRVVAFEVEDSFTAYGLVGAVLIEPGVIRQWVMSCRVLGYQVEQAVMAWIVERMRPKGRRKIVGRLVETDVNFPCRALFASCGFKAGGEDVWHFLGRLVTKPPHVEIIQ